MVKEVTLSNGSITIIDDGDVGICEGRIWENHHGYASIKTQKDQIKKRLYLHREIMKAPKGMVVDHINKNTLDNRRCNLRICHHSENMRNMKRRCDSRFKYKGIRYNRHNRNWNARIRINSKEIHLGCFETEVQAAKAYNLAAVKYHGEFAQLNVIEEN